MFRIFKQCGQYLMFRVKTVLRFAKQTLDPRFLTKNWKYTIAGVLMHGNNYTFRLQSSVKVRKSFKLFIILLLSALHIDFQSRCCYSSSVELWKNICK